MNRNHPSRRDLMITGPSLRAHVDDALAIHEGNEKLVNPSDYRSLIDKFAELKAAINALGVARNDPASMKHFSRLKDQAKAALNPLHKSIEAMVEAANK